MYNIFSSENTKTRAQKCQYHVIRGTESVYITNMNDGTIWHTSTQNEPSFFDFPLRFERVNDVDLNTDHEECVEYTIDFSIRNDLSLIPYDGEGHNVGGGDGGKNNDDAVRALYYNCVIDSPLEHDNFHCSICYQYKMENDLQRCNRCKKCHHLDKCHMNIYGVHVCNIDTDGNVVECINLLDCPTDFHSCHRKKMKQNINSPRKKKATKRKRRTNAEIEEEENAAKKPRFDAGIFRTIAEVDTELVLIALYVEQLDKKKSAIHIENMDSAQYKRYQRLVNLCDEM